MQVIMRLRAFALVLAAALVLQACTTAQRVDQADRFAKAGVQLTDTLPEFYDEYYEMAIKADSATLKLVRKEPGITPARLRAQLQEANKDLEETAALLAGMKEHADLLNEYFEAIEELTDESVGEDLGRATSNMVDGMGKVRAALPSRDPFGVDIDKATRPAGNFAVVALKNKALREELEAHGATIDAELALQEEVLKALGASMMENHQAWVITSLENPMYAGYERAGKDLPAKWGDIRVKYLTQRDQIGAANEASEAVKDMREAWRELAGGGPEASTVNRLISRIKATQLLIKELGA